MSAMQRRKGAEGEREVVRALKDRGIDAKRTAPLQTAQAHGAADVLAFGGIHLEVKRQERICMEEWCRQAERDSAGRSVPVVVWRRTRQPWRVTLPLDDFLDLIEETGRA